MQVQEYVRAVFIFMIIAAAGGVFVNFLALVIEELKKCSIMNEKKRKYEVLLPSERLL